MASKDQEQQQGMVDERTVAEEQAKMSARGRGFELTDAEAKRVVAEVEKQPAGTDTTLVRPETATNLRETAMRLQAEGYDPSAPEEEHSKAATALVRDRNLQVTDDYDYAENNGEVPLPARVARAMAERPSQDLKEPFLVGLPAKGEGESWEKFSARQGELLAAAYQILAAAAVEQGGILRVTAGTMRALERGTAVTFPARIVAEEDVYVVASGPTVRPADPGPVAFTGGRLSVRIAHVTNTQPVLA